MTSEPYVCTICGETRDGPFDLHRPANSDRRTCGGEVVPLAVAENARADDAVDELADVEGPHETVWMLDGPDRGRHVVQSPPPPRCALSAVAGMVVEERASRTAVGWVVEEISRPVGLRWYERFRFTRSRGRGQVWAYRYVGQDSA